MPMQQQKRQAIYSGAFVDPVFQSQSVFRAIMDAVARPGTVHSLTDGVAPPVPLGAGAGAIALTLCDSDTPVWLTPGLRQSSVPAWLAFHAGAPVTDMKADARFAFVERGGLIPGFDQFSAGTQDYPDRSTTLVLEIEALSGGPAMIATGPGIKEAPALSPRGLPGLFPTLWADNGALFPRGVDLILVAGTDILCLPRTTKLKEA